MKKFEKGTILVATANQKTGCGILYVKSGSIIKVAEDSPAHRSSVYIYRNQEAEKEDRTHVISKDKVCLATPEEREAWADCVYFISDMKVKFNELSN
jgi:hypothetical protein